FERRRSPGQIVRGKQQGREGSGQVPSGFPVLDSKLITVFYGVTAQSVSYAAAREPRDVIEAAVFL
ncbi:hypothetical protein RA278_29685, partial [Pseudomonas syringae pv. tagetis]|uniref:hypothetical protein n=1 Tax=Pseudomonas syringae group genomosp. 7 TaxID=251699 RepID=UPI00376F4C16